MSFIDNTINLLYYYSANKRERNMLMNRTFIEVPVFTKKWKELGLGDEPLRELQRILLQDTKTGDAIQGTGGLRKIRIPMENKGKKRRWSSFIY